MVIEEFRDLLAKEKFPAVRHQDARRRAYPVTHRTNAHIAPAYPTTVLVAVRGQGITLLDIAAIESVESEHEVTASGE